jgi:molybdate transport system ATP-binding protein
MTASLNAQFAAERDGFKFSIDVRGDKGDIIAIVGPNGSGKSSALHAIAGLVPISEGTISLNGRSLDDGKRRVPVDRRNCALVFQDHRLFPHMSVIDNVAYAPRTRMKKAKARKVAQQWIDRLGLDELTKRNPQDLSGGQHQRIAIARALASDPDLLMLDEPLSALDVDATRVMRQFLKETLSSYDGVTLLVTHDPTDALALADKILVIESGKVSQSGSPTQIKEHPATRYVAEFVGINRLEGQAQGNHVLIHSGAEVTTAEQHEGPVALIIHPSAVALHASQPSGSPRNTFPGTITHMEEQAQRIRLTIDGPLPIVAELTPGAVAALELKVSKPVWIAIKATEISVRPE